MRKDMVKCTNNKVHRAVMNGYIPYFVHSSHAPQIIQSRESDFSKKLSILILYIYIYVYVSIYIYLCNYIVCIYIYRYLCVHIFMYFCMFMHIYLHFIVFFSIYITHAHIYIYICIFVYFMRPSSSIAGFIVFLKSSRSQGGQ